MAPFQRPEALMGSVIVSLTCPRFHIRFLVDLCPDGAEVFPGLEVRSSPFGLPTVNIGR